MKFKGRSQLLTLAVLISLAAMAVVYQNCSGMSGSGGSSFNLGSNSTSTLAIASIQLGQTLVQPSAPFSAAAMVTGATAITCEWLILNSSNAVVSTTGTSTVNGVCTFTGQAPPAVGNYTLSLVATIAQNQATQQSAPFQVSTSAPPPIATPTPILGASPSPASCFQSNYECYACVNSQSNCNNLSTACGGCCNGYHFTSQTTGPVTVNTYYCN